MEITYNIPLKYKEGTYKINELKDMGDNILVLNHSDYGDIVTYRLPDRKYGGEIRLYQISKELLDNTLQGIYDAKGCLKLLTIQKNGKEAILYIHYEDAADTLQIVESFARENAKVILEKIALCKEKVSRLFVEYFNDGEYMDFHAKIGTEAEKNALQEKYPQYKDIGDSCGDYRAESLAGDNGKLAILISCADNDEDDYFQLAVDIMTQMIEEEGAALVDKAADFKFMCQEYD
ncbi:MAG: hypothetical protein IKK33_03975 [Lachnospiraceae bacterium]|nr:hypothetical protein [Lachnospiraceae bacterium]